MNNDTITPLPPTGQPSPHTARRSIAIRPTPYGQLSEYAKQIKLSRGDFVEVLLAHWEGMDDRARAEAIVARLGM